MHTPDQADSVDRELTGWLDQMLDVDQRVEAARQRIGRLARLFTRTLDAVAAEQRISVGDWEALSVLVRHGGDATPSQLAQALRLTSGTVSTRLNRLVAAGLAELRTNTDGRSRPVGITAEGRRRWQQATAARTRAERELFAVLGADQQDTLNELLRTLLAGYETALGEASRHDSR